VHLPPRLPFGSRRATGWPGWPWPHRSPSMPNQSYCSEALSYSMLMVDWWASAKVYRRKLVPGRRRSRPLQGRRC
jgi:hypothetical protein